MVTLIIQRIFLKIAVKNKNPANFWCHYILREIIAISIRFLIFWDLNSYAIRARIFQGWKRINSEVILIIFSVVRHLEG